MSRIIEAKILTRENFAPFGDVIDTGGDTPVAAIDVGPRPWGIALSADGHTLYTANGPSNDVSVVDVARRAVTGRISVGESPWGLALGALVP